MDYQNAEVQAIHQSYWYEISRTALKFDTSAYPNPASVRLCVCRSVGPQHAAVDSGHAVLVHDDGYEEFDENEHVQVGGARWHGDEPL